MGISERKERDRLQRNALILKSAKSLFIEKGFGATTMQDIADRAELGRRTLYMYFKTKDEIVSSIAAEVIQEVCRLVKEASGKSGSGRERLENTAKCFSEYHNSHPDDFLLIFNANLNNSFSVHDGEASIRIEAFLSFLTTVISDILEAGFRDGSLRSSGNSVEVTARTMVVSILGTLRILALYPLGKKERDEQLVLLIRMITSYVNFPDSD